MKKPPKTKLRDDGPAMPWKRPPRCNAALSSGRASCGVERAAGRGGSWWRSRAGGGGECARGGWEGWADPQRAPFQNEGGCARFYSVLCCSVLFCFIVLSFFLVRSLSFWPFLFGSFRFVLNERDLVEPLGGALLVVAVHGGRDEPLQPRHRPRDDVSHKDLVS